MYSESDRCDLFIAIDGDHVGDTLEYHLARCDLAQARGFSQEVAHVIRELDQRLEQAGATVHFSGGDNLIASMPKVAFEPRMLQDLPRQPCTFSVGLGWDSRSALMALKVAKALGRNQVFSMLGDDHTRKEVGG